MHVPDRIRRGGFFVVHPFFARAGLERASKRIPFRRDEAFGGTPVRRPEGA
jgi:hypothetical protein